MKNVIKSIAAGSPAAGTIAAPGDVLRKINGHEIGDILDYKYYSYNANLMIELTGAGDKLKVVRLRKPEGEDLGLEFDTFLMDKERSCANKCIFCFIDQLPEGMRETLYYKDDDVRLSFLQGNYVTLTNLTQNDIERIIKLRISPLNVSVHSLDPELRAHMLGIKNGAAGIRSLKTLASAGTTLNCQIVCCPYVNDGAQLVKTLQGLFALGDSIKSVSVVPVGLTKHRQGLAKLRPYNRDLALETVKTVRRFGEMSLRKLGKRLFFCADELYIKAGLRLPSNEHYEDYPQLENGVGMMRLFITEFMDELNNTPRSSSDGVETGSSFTVATGTASAGYLSKLIMTAAVKYGRIQGKIRPIRNDFFGSGVSVSGLVTGNDMIDQLKGNDLGSRLLIPINMLKHGEEIFLDDVTVSDLSQALGVPVRIVKQDGADFFRAILE